jgi:hypothetical protein
MSLSFVPDKKLPHITNVIRDGNEIAYISKYSPQLCRIFFWDGLHASCNAPTLPAAKRKIIATLIAEELTK